MAERARVIAGSAGGTRLESPPSGTRPLADRVKQALFSSLDAADALRGPFLDLFAGSGAAGIEALSRGAPAATFVEREPRACAVISSNLARARLERGTVVCDDVMRHLARGPAPGEDPYAAALVDPPYDDGQLDPALESLAGAGWLTADAVVVAKHFWRTPPADEIGTLLARRRRRFGETMLSFYTRHEEGR